ncbi:hypothetical protein AAZX31_02G192700 [Glycine max]|uniref:TRF2/HOY1 PH-like domain-containing protein n=1 Tax=Glycine max TaxID=3847 RepID=I1JGS7_SOYBN|nr:uncharacterized protein LOC100794550 isoform X2 [Glycine max]KAH1061342.1 hypothetical protein GYH30_004700 [Glycine max]KAH1262699.1 hypothetical protein GmHk_02G005262 [Glycine max]KRH72344.1 hypothetical protein GLYMA_02G206600v4 [Glycine max]|eukprot:XP_006575320.1 uncharacterized protein LOC100794550 isoform X2 [Glycine max]
MVQVMGFRKLRSDLETVPFKLEIEEPLQEEHAPLNKRFKSSSTSQEQWNASNSASSSSPSQYNILDEPSPLGLRLRKSPSLLDLIEMKLSQGNVIIANTQNENFLSSGLKKESRGAAASDSVEKLKASNFPASLLRIGSWEYKSKHEGDLVAKCYFAKHKLVWEVLEGELKNKMEIQWSDIMALKANCPDTGPSSLTVVLARQPLFFKETNPQPRKHTIWQATSDFTEGEACKHRQHFLEFPQGLLAKHFEKLIQCDTHLNFLSQQPEIILDSPHFDTRPAAFENLDNPEDLDLHLVNCKGSTTSCLQDIGSPHSSLSPSFKIEHNDLLGIASDNLPCEAPFPSSGSTSSETDFKGPRNWDQIKLPGLRPSMAVSDFIGHIEHCLSEQITSGNPSFCGGRPEFQEMLEEIAQHLLNDNKVITTSDEKSLMTRVNSLCCLLQKDPAALQSSHDKESADEGPADGKSIQLSHDLESMQNNKIKMDVKASEEEFRDVSRGKQTLGMPRKDSLGELLLQLPRIASLSKFLFDISEDSDN